MFSEAKVTEIFCMADDFCKEFAKTQEKYMVEDTAVFFIVCLLSQEDDYFHSAGVYAISEGVYLIRKTPDQLFSFNRRMCLLILGKDSFRDGRAGCARLSACSRKARRHGDAWPHA